jgi:predicted TIM-barrel fold metal-dependent hydrolase
MLELEHGFRIVDVHVELEPAETKRPRGIGGPEQIEREMRQAGIVEALAFAGGRDEEYLKANNAVARMAVERPMQALARINGVRDPGQSASARLRNVTRRRGDHHTSPEDIEQYGYEDRFVGFMIDPASNGLPEEAVLERLEDVGLPVLTYGGREFPPESIEETLLQYDFPLVVSHFGGYPLAKSLMAEAIDMLERHDECFLDTSFVRLRDPLERAIMEHPDRVLFGSGAPAAHPSVAVMEILTLDVPEDAMRKVFSKNATRLL